jgi:hypothetical protein
MIPMALSHFHTATTHYTLLEYTHKKKFAHKRQK